MKMPAGIYLLKVNTRNTRTKFEVCSKLSTKTPERCRRLSGVFIVSFEHISHLDSHIVNFEQINAGWGTYC